MGSASSDASSHPPAVLNGLREIANTLRAIASGAPSEGNQRDTLEALALTFEKYLPILELEQRRTPLWADATEGFCQSALSFIDQHVPARPELGAVRESLNRLMALCREASPARNL